MLIATINDGRTAAYFGDGNSVSRLMGIGDSGLNGLPVKAIMNIAAADNGYPLLMAPGNYATGELRYYDGAHHTVIPSTAETLLDSVGLSYFWSNECTLALNGDAHCMAATDDGGTGVCDCVGEGVRAVRRCNCSPAGLSPGGTPQLNFPLSCTTIPNTHAYHSRFFRHVSAR